MIGNLGTSYAKHVYAHTTSNTSHTPELQTTLRCSTGFGTLTSKKGFQDLTVLEPEAGRTYSLALDTHAPSLFWVPGMPDTIPRLHIESSSLRKFS